ncbi:sulfite exporter TauE/SafE family protein [Streptosporangium sp. NPDC051022]|uniref:sulfite exporter TauE/SafE family protein n=1 Tax=Streptosporangium sp. NPDC051022 TaxID=3155752 RepID=UPI003414CE94
MTGELLTLIMVGTAVLLGAIVQGSVGFGLGLMAVPMVTMLNPGAMPGAVQVVNATLPLFTLAAEWRLIDWRGVGFAVLGRLPGSFLGGLVVLYVSKRSLGLLVGVMVLAAVGLTVWAVSVPRNGRTITGAGFVSGITGTATGVGGPPMALVYQNAKGPQIRATLAMFFLLSAVQSMIILAALDRFPAHALTFGALLIPFVVAGFLISRPLRRFLDAGRIRTAILVVAAISALTLIAQSTLG